LLDRLQHRHYTCYDPIKPNVITSIGRDINIMMVIVMNTIASVTCAAVLSNENLIELAIIACSSAADLRFETILAAASSWSLA
jgi:hypothetical protein